ncbi:cysteine--tRNA ligase [candidate division WWE3 bacterium RIFCSPLOWO2_12_FULL_36_10]|uniref:Cysteine--tRNA ligase n=1 Tax=candidate division WWE3 bacterium RIFCSPLOWO2_12_FULL_36_10 TaxID=1802630 RepID=A0A1F4VIG4_UNCKA|nr:MAG: cysteine--tRNA ligase [candidate division WWE3 bacterium RIFCSPLOWO2_12_FULL_36_10]
MALQLYNSLTRKVEDFIPINPNLVTMYVCGPTVYDFVSIGNFRTYTTGDLLFRVLSENGYKVKYIMNLTDVGHLTGDNLGDADSGEDRIEMSAEKEGKSSRDIANFYIQDFIKNYERLGLKKPDKFTKATDYIKDQIELIKMLERKGFTYKITDGLYFDTSTYKDYGKLSGMKENESGDGARIEPNLEKKNPLDFALWKFSPKDKMRWQEWDSPWGRGFPGWHIECSAMILTELGENIDIHAGGEDLRMIHHQNEIAQSECATGKKFASYWVHTAFLQVDGGRMGRSIGNAYTLPDIEAKGFTPAALRYFYMGAHYRKKLNFTWEALQNAQNAVKKLYDLVGTYEESKDAVLAIDFLDKFNEALNDDINMPEALAVVWELVKSEVAESSKITTLLKFDEVLGLGIENYVGFEIPVEIENLARVRTQYRKSGIWDKADLIRREIESKGYLVEDVADGFRIKRKV